MSSISSGSESSIVSNETDLNRINERIKKKKWRKNDKRKKTTN